MPSENCVLTADSLERCRRTVPFTTGEYRAKSYPEEDPYNDNHFDVVGYVPEDFRDEATSARPKDIIILVNGLGEFKEDLYTGSSGLCARFCAVGIASYFMPLPFHFNRMSQTDEHALSEEVAALSGRVRTAIADFKQSHPSLKGRVQDHPDFVIPPLQHPAARRIIERKPRFFLAYNQLVEDLNKLTRHIQKEASTGLLPENVRISLWGYSIGGIGVLARFLDDPTAYHACVLVHSGAAFDRLGRYGTLFSQEDWDGLRAFWKNIADQLERGHDEVLAEWEEISSIKYRDLESFSRVFLDIDNDQLKEMARASSNKLLITLGAEDVVFSLESVQGTLVPKVGLPIQIFPSTKHEDVHSSPWLDYQIEVVKAFLEKHP